ncbi:hypothetical protein FMUND_14551 [Fusarium mundagurra]|uniref:Uncharacterized protein n=1 Tax=Fusarium mundagurra TaxID=1567541 RepID=A0A8H6D1X2_9HYPO|nr:hypothetical protein FMUND_14551 [Fusarium mundagurra]
MHLARLVVPFRLPASRNVGGRARDTGFVSNRTPVLTQFGRLEWLVLAPTQVKPGAVGVIREDPKGFGTQIAEAPPMKLRTIS